MVQLHLITSLQQQTKEKVHKQWNKYFQNTYDQRRQSQNRPGDGIVIEEENNLASTTNYDAYVVEWESSNQVDISHVSVSPQKCIVLVPTSGSTTGAGIETALNCVLGGLNLPTI